MIQWMIQWLLFNDSMIQWLLFNSMIPWFQWITERPGPEYMSKTWPPGPCSGPCCSGIRGITANCSRRLLAHWSHWTVIGPLDSLDHWVHWWWISWFSIHYYVRVITESFIHSFIQFMIHWFRSLLWLIQWLIHWLIDWLIDWLIHWLIWTPWTDVDVDLRYVTSLRR